MIAWNEAMGRPNAKRPTAYSRAMSSAAWPPPTCSKATSTAARSSTRSSKGQPAPGSPSGSAGVFAKVIDATERVGSTVSSGARLTPAPRRSTRNSDTARPSRAATTAKSATSPSTTGAFVPLSTPFTARVVSDSGVGAWGPSASARQPMASPAAIRGSQRRFCASDPASNSASAAR